MDNETALEERAINPKPPSPVCGVAIPNPGNPPDFSASGIAAYRDRTFFLGSEMLASGGARTRGWNPSLAYFCPACATIWGRVILGSGNWHAVSIRCRAHGGGSFLTPLVWWDYPNGRDPASQLDTFPAAVIRYEAEIRAFGSKGGLGI